MHQHPYDHEKDPRAFNDEITTPYPETRPAGYREEPAYMVDPNRDLTWMWVLVILCGSASVIWLVLFWPIALVFLVPTLIAGSVIRDTKRARRNPTQES